MARQIRQNANLSYAAREQRLKLGVGMEGCEKHKLIPDSDCELCKFRQRIVPSGAANSEMTRITIRDERVVTLQEILSTSVQEMASSSTGQRINVEIPKENVQDMKLQYFSFNDIFETDADMLPNTSPSICLRSGYEDRQAP